MEKAFVVFSIARNGKRYAVADTIRAGENLLAHSRRYNADVCYLCKSRQEAEQMALDWNKSYKKNGTYLF